MPTAMPTQADKAALLNSLHAGPSGFIIPNPWDIGSARILEGMGFKALASTSAGLAFSKGRMDNQVRRDELMAHLAELASATRVPISADLENGFGDHADSVGETIRLAASAGAVGGSIEDSTGRDDEPLYPLAHAVDRVRAAVAAARTLPFPFSVVARAENFVSGRPDLADVISRLQAYEDVGADVLFAPGLTSASDIATVVRSVSRPVNVIVGFRGISLSADQLFELGVRRVSTGASLARAALGELIRAGTELQSGSASGYTSRSVTSAHLATFFSA